MSEYRMNEQSNEVYAADEGWGPWWVPRALGHSRSSVRTFVAGLTGERYVDLTVAAKRGRLDWHDVEGWRFTRSPDGDLLVWEVSQA